MGFNRKGGQSLAWATGKEGSRTTKWTGWDTIQRAADRVAHEDAVRRGGLEASEACRNRALRERDISHAQPTDVELKSRDAAFFFRNGCERVLGERAQACG